MFTAYDKVAYEQYDLYIEYAELVPSAATRHLALKIFYASPFRDPELDSLNAEISLDKLNMRHFIPEEYKMFAIRSSDGEHLDIYLLDEDRLLMKVIPLVPWADARATALNMIKNWESYPHQR